MNDRIHLCQLVRHASNGKRKSCFAIWHDDWACGRAMPSHVRFLRFRRTASQTTASHRDAIVHTQQEGRKEGRKEGIKPPILHVIDIVDTVST